MQSVLDGQVVADSGPFPTERADNGGLIVLDGHTSIVILNFGRNSTLNGLAGIRSSFLQNLRTKPQFGRRNLPETDIAAGDNTGFKYVTVGPDGKTNRAAYILRVRGGCVVVQIGNDIADSFDERKYEESLLPTIQIE